MSNNKSIPDVSSLLGNIAKKQKNGELGSSPLQTVKPIAKPVEETNSDIKEFKSKNAKTTKTIDNISSEADRRPQGGRPTVKREDVEYMKISPRIPKELRQEIGVKLMQERFIDSDGQKIKTLDELVTYALEKLSGEVR
jgi:hypothetical protein